MSNTTMPNSTPGPTPLNKFEIAHVIGIRALELAEGKQPALGGACSTAWSVREIAIREMLAGTLDGQIVRADGTCAPLHRVRLSLRSRRSLEAQLTNRN